MSRARLVAYRLLGGLEAAERASDGVDDLLQVARRCLAPLQTTPSRRRPYHDGLAARPDCTLTPLDGTWLEPLPEGWLAGAARETVALPFVSALQALTPTQRLALVLVDLEGLPLEQVAALCETSTAALGSALQRARAVKVAHLPPAPSTQSQKALEARLLHGWSAASVDGLVAALADDAQLALVPMAQWFKGRADITKFLHGYFPAVGGPGALQGTPVACAQGVAVRLVKTSGEPFTVLVAELGPHGVARLTGFGQPGVSARF